MNRMMRKMRANEDGNGLIFALLVLFVCISIAAIVAALALTNSVSSKNLNGSLAYRAATSTALAHALQVANAPAPNGGYDVLYSHQGAANAVTGTAPTASSTYPIKWRWYSLRVASEGGQANSWYIYADAYKTNPSEINARHVRSLFSPLTTKSAAGGAISADGSQAVTYFGDSASAFVNGLLGTNGVTLNNAKIYSYSSTSTLTPSSTSNRASVATNQVLTLGNNTGLNVFTKFRGATCAPVTNCPPNNGITEKNYDFNYGLNGVATAAATACVVDHGTWTSSSGVALQDGWCYNTLIFDSNYPSDGSQILNTTRVYVKGNVTVKAKQQVNSNNSPTKLQIYSQAGSSAVFENGTAVEPTRFYGVVAGSGLNCKDTDTNSNSPSSLFFYGGLACSTLNFGPSTTLWSDAAAGNASTTTSVSTVYTPTYFEVYSK